LDLSVTEVAAHLSLALCAALRARVISL
ncbi:MAG: hypothetical protein RL017_94, partial [Pseudomonadota bacterium]